MHFMQSTNIWTSKRATNRHTDHNDLWTAAPAYVIAKDIIHLILCLQELIEKDMKFCPHCGAEVKKEEMPQECEDIFAESDVSESAKMEETTEEVIEDIMEKAADVTKVSVEHVKDAASEIAEDVRESVHEVKEHIKESVEDIRE